MAQLTKQTITVEHVTIKSNILRDQRCLARALHRVERDEFESQSLHGATPTSS